MSVRLKIILGSVLLLILPVVITFVIFFGAPQSELQFTIGKFHDFEWVTLFVAHQPSSLAPVERFDLDLHFESKNWRELPITEPFEVTIPKPTQNDVLTAYRRTGSEPFSGPCLGSCALCVAI